MSSSNKIIYKINGYDYVKKYLKSLIYRALTRNSLNAFVRSYDSIAISPQVNGDYDPALIKVIEKYCFEGYSDYFIDIGANIGMVSCQVQNKFKYVHMFEPNKLCAKILEVNVQLNSDRENYFIYEYGLGNKNKEAILKIPKRNWGGAFIEDDENSYSSELLAEKEGRSEFINSDLLTIKIEIKKASDSLGFIFKELTKSGNLNGIIKIDVEGYEYTILKEIAKCRPDNLNMVIIFESWNGSIPINEIFTDVISYQRISRLPPWKEKWPKIIKLLMLFLGLQVKYHLDSERNNEQGDYVVKLGSKVG